MPSKKKEENFLWQCRLCKNQFVRANMGNGGPNFHLKRTHPLDLYITCQYCDKKSSNLFKIKHDAPYDERFKELNDHIEKEHNTEDEHKNPTLHHCDEDHCDTWMKWKNRSEHRTHFHSQNCKYNKYAFGPEKKRHRMDNCEGKKECGARIKGGKKEFILHRKEVHKLLKESNKISTTEFELAKQAALLRKKSDKKSDTDANSAQGADSDQGADADQGAGDDQGADSDQGNQVENEESSNNQMEVDSDSNQENDDNGEPSNTGQNADANSDPDADSNNGQGNPPPEESNNQMEVDSDLNQKHDDNGKPSNIGQNADADSDPDDPPHSDVNDESSNKDTEVDQDPDVDSDPDPNVNDESRNNDQDKNNPADADGKNEDSAAKVEEELELVCKISVPCSNENPDKRFGNKEALKKHLEEDHKDKHL